MLLVTKHFWWAVTSSLVSSGPVTSVSSLRTQRTQDTRGAGLISRSVICLQIKTDKKCLSDLQTCKSPQGCVTHVINIRVEPRSVSFLRFTRPNRCSCGRLPGSCRSIPRRPSRTFLWTVVFTWTNVLVGNTLVSLPLNYYVVPCNLDTF